ncbi:MAG: restriction endonuclease [Planctomycetes bacterium]|nr:restriction endonuclease [Planctomycetota bacterium]
MSKGQMTYLAAAERILREQGQPMHVHDLMAAIAAAGLVESSGKTPEATLHAQLAVAVKRSGTEGAFVRVRPAVFGLGDWLRDGRIKLQLDGDSRVRVPDYPTNAQVDAVLRVLPGLARGRIRALQNRLAGLTGTNKDSVDWSDPDAWIGERLDGEDEETARRVWQGTKGKVNPRWLEPPWRLACGYGLLEPDGGETMRITEDGRRFLAEPEGEVVQSIDGDEGLLRILSIIAEEGPIATGEMQGPWGDFLQRESRIRSDSAIRMCLQARLRNLVQRGYIERSGRPYALTPAGFDYLARTGSRESGDRPDDQSELLTLIRQQRGRVLESARELLSQMDPFAFEQLVKTLLESMGYEDVEVTARSGDMGVDVIGRITLGITEVKEVVQVKRHKNNVQRTVLDALRGSLHRFQAVRGTIITLGDFARGTKAAAFEPGAAPITLINGDKLIDLLLEHEIGFRRKKVELLELDSSAFEQIEDSLGSTSAST